MRQSRQSVGHRVGQLRLRAGYRRDVHQCGGERHGIRIEIEVGHAGTVASVTRAFGFGLATITDDDRVLDTWYPAPTLDAPATEEPPAKLTGQVGRDDRRRVRTELVATEI